MELTFIKAAVLFQALENYKPTGNTADKQAEVAAELMTELEAYINTIGFIESAKSADF